MEEKNLNEAQVAEQTTSQDENKNVNELDALKRELEELELSYKTLDADNSKLLEKYESEKKSCLRYYRQMNMLKQAITKLTEEGKITEDDVVKAVLVGQNLMGIDDLLFTLAD